MLGRMSPKWAERLRSKRVTIALSLTNAVLLLVAAVGALTVQPVGANQEKAAAPAPQASDSSPDIATPTVPEASSGGSGGGSAAPAQPAPQGSKAPAGTPGAQGASPKASAEGAYTRRLDWEFEAPARKKGGGETVTQVSTKGRTPAEVRQLHDTKMASTDEDDGDGRFVGTVGPRDIRWTAEGMYVSQPRSDGSTCEPEDSLELRLPPTVGLRWTSTRVCNSSSGGRNQTDTTSEVTGSRTATVAGKEMPVWEVVSEATTRAEGAQSGASLTTETTMLFSLDLGVAVKVDSVVSYGSFLRFKYTTKLTSVDLA